MVLKDWITSLLPNREMGDVEAGYCFIRISDGENVLRKLDIRYLDDKYSALFWLTLEKTIPQLKGDDSDFLFHDLLSQYQESINDKYIAPDILDKGESLKYRLVKK